MRERPVAVLTEHLSAEALSWLAQSCQVMMAQHDAPDLAEALRTAEALVVRTYTIVDESLLERAPRLRVVGRAGTGLDHIDVPACRRRGVEVVYTPDANTQAVVEYVLALVSDALRPRPTLQHALSPEDWSRWRQRHVGRQLSEMAMGVLGLGRIGRRVAQVGSVLGAAVLYHDIAPVAPGEATDAERVAVEELFERSDVLTIHVDGRASNRGFVSEGLLGRMKRDVVLVNTSRGFVVDNESLRAFLQSRPHAEAHLDVHDPEPFDGSYPLLGLPNAKLYPHLGSRTDAAMSAMSWVVRDVVAVLEGRPARFPAP